MMAAACRGWSAPREAWPSGVTARDTLNGNNSLYWPTGIRARDNAGNWNYPSGIAVSRGDRYYWPNGVAVRDAAGNWYAPTGVRPAPGMLLGEACRVTVDPRFCGRAWGEPNMMELIAFVWRARGGR